MGASRLLIAIGAVLIAAGVFIHFAGRLPFKLGRLPGDIFFHGKHGSFYFPLTTCILLSGALSLLLWALRRWAASFATGRSHGGAASPSASPQSSL